MPVLLQGFYDRGKELNWKNMKDLQFVGAMGPPGGARNNLDPRFVSLFDAFEVQFPSTSNLQTIYTSILAHHVASLSDDIKGSSPLTTCQLNHVVWWGMKLVSIVQSCMSSQTANKHCSP